MASLTQPYLTSLRLRGEKQSDRIVSMMRPTTATAMSSRYSNMSSARSAFLNMSFKSRPQKQFCLSSHGKDTVIRAKTKMSIGGKRNNFMPSQILSKTQLSVVSGPKRQLKYESTTLVAAATVNIVPYSFDDDDYKFESAESDNQHSANDDEEKWKAALEMFKGKKKVLKQSAVFLNEQI